MEAGGAAPSSGVAAALAIAADGCEMITGKILHELARSAATGVVARRSREGAAALAVAAEACELITGKILHEPARSTAAGVFAGVRKRRKGRRRRRKRGKGRTRRRERPKGRRGG